jgi:hypothetical protein
MNEVHELEPIRVSLDWYLYFLMREDAITSVAVDLTFASDPDAASLRWLTVIRVVIPDPVGGLAFNERAEDLDALAERFEEVLASGGTGLVSRLLRRPRERYRYVGRVTGAGVRKLYFYGTAAVPASAYRKVFADERFDPYETGSADREDPHHETYRDVLHPGGALHALINGDAQIEMRKEQGDDLETARDVDHTLLFPTAADRQAFLAFMEREDPQRTFAITAPDDDGKDDFLVNVRARHSVDKLWTNIYVVALTEKAGRFNGKYDGWGALVMQRPS